MAKKISACNKKHIKTVSYDDNHNITVEFGAVAFDIARSTIEKSTTNSDAMLPPHCDQLGSVTTDRFNINNWGDIQIPSYPGLVGAWKIVIHVYRTKSKIVINGKDAFEY